MDNWITQEIEKDKAERRWPHGWWILPGAVIGLVFWIILILAAWKALEAYL